MSHSTHVISLSPQAKRYVFILIKKWIPLTCLKMREENWNPFKLQLKLQLDTQRKTKDYEMPKLEKKRNKKYLRQSGTNSLPMKNFIELMQMISR